MIDRSPTAYYRSRERQELAQAAASSTPAAAAIHRDLAARYAALAGTMRSSRRRAQPGIVEAGST